jgi:hypothetical protein
MFASGQESAQAFARSRTIEAFVLKRSLKSVVEADMGFITLTISGHARLSRDTSRNQNNIRTLQAFSQARRCRVVSLDCALCVDMAEISSNTYPSLPLLACFKHHWVKSGERTWSQSNIVQGKL